MYVAAAAESEAIAVSPHNYNSTKRAARANEVAIDQFALMPGFAKPAEM